MTTLELQNCEWNDETKVSDNCREPYTFKSLGKRDTDTDTFKAPGDNLPPIGEILTLVSGKFPLTNDDLYELYTFKNKDAKKYELKLDGFDVACRSGKENRYGKCSLDVLVAGEQQSEGGGKRRKKKKKTKRTKRTKRTSRKI